MGRFGTAGGIALGLGAGALALLAGLKRRDDRMVEATWQSLAAIESTPEPFREEMVAGLPEPARRYFLHAIRPGAPLANRIRFAYCGEIRPAENMGWLPLSAEEILVKNRGFVWKARVGKGPLLVTGADYYYNGDARMRIALYGLLPVVNASDPDTARSALGRLLIEAALFPSAVLPGPNVRLEGVDEARFKAVIDLHGQTTPLTFTVASDGRLRELSMPRWGNFTPDRSFREIPYGAFVDEERTFGDYTVAGRVRVGWWFGTERYLEVVRLAMERVEFE